MLHHARGDQEGAFFREYASFCDDPVIGSYVGLRKNVLRILAAHELAHWLQYSADVVRPEGRYQKPHGEGFRSTYRILRTLIRDGVLDGA